MSSLCLRMEECDDQLKMVWSDEQSSWNPAHYFVHKGFVRQASESVRKVLDEISADIRREGLKNPILHRQWLPKLADSGHVLATQIFSPIDYGKGTAEKVREIIATAAEPMNLTVFTDGSVHVPWAFLYRGDPLNFQIADLPDETQITDFSDFWLGLFKINVRYCVTDRLHSRRPTRDTFRFLYALNKELFRDALTLLPEEEQGICNRLLAEEVGEVTTWTDCREKWRSIQNNNSVIYIFGHSEGDDFVLENEEHITAAAFNTLFRKADGVSDTVCVLNGCRTGVGPLFDSFLAATSGPGFHGFIGTEAQVANNCAASYGIAFMKRLCENGDSVGEAFESLQMEKFPTSLFYTCYANPDFRVPKHLE
ncbi:hypothetical protein MRS76_25695 [Rhizobiaceae bacterium n13]|uniref:hypothetical protein n=1 Tax=Ferirhizobium litorale TaxID=2927786 RepID=UPI0024B2DB2E|nr:hypothetical protein [Fererhizobium litorale]MDI7865292.1 hypothetical protein [Fererhizobium litorale]